MTTRRRVLLSAYACEPDSGSEPGIGWHAAVQLSQSYEVWVVTRESNREAIERETARRPRPHIHFAYTDLPAWARWWKKGGRGVQIYYYLWQLWIYRLVRRLHRREGCDVVQHITFGRYWAPSLLALTGVPFVWGPVGGGDSVPSGLEPAIEGWGSLLFRMRRAARWLGEHDPLVRLTARRSTIALATTPATATRLRALGASDVRLLPAAALPDADVAQLNTLRPPTDETIRFVSVGKLIYWKAFGLGLRAFAEAAIPNAELTILGDGPERPRLEALASQLGIEHRIEWCGNVPRDAVLVTLETCHALVHPSFHDSGGWVCLEAMAARRPVICLDCAGPAVLVGNDAGIRVPAGGSDDRVVRELAAAMQLVASDGEARRRMGADGKRQVENAHSWSVRGRQLTNLLDEAVSSRGGIRGGH